MIIATALQPLYVAVAQNLMGAGMPAVLPDLHNIVAVQTAAIMPLALLEMFQIFVDETEEKSLAAACSVWADLGFFVVKIGVTTLLWRSGCSIKAIFSSSLILLALRVAVCAAIAARWVETPMTRGFAQQYQQVNKLDVDDADAVPEDGASDDADDGSPPLPIHESATRTVLGGLAQPFSDGFASDSVAHCSCSFVRTVLRSVLWASTGTFPSIILSLGIILSASAFVPAFDTAKNDTELPGSPSLPLPTKGISELGLQAIRCGVLCFGLVSPAAGDFADSFLRNAWVAVLRNAHQEARSSTFLGALAVALTAFALGFPVALMCDLLPSLHGEYSTLQLVMAVSFFVVCDCVRTTLTSAMRIVALPPRWTLTCMLFAPAVFFAARVGASITGNNWWFLGIFGSGGATYAVGGGGNWAICIAFVHLFACIVLSVMLFSNISMCCAHRAFSVGRGRLWESALPRIAATSVLIEQQRHEGLIMYTSLDNAEDIRAMNDLEPPDEHSSDGRSGSARHNGDILARELELPSLSGLPSGEIHQTRSHTVAGGGGIVGPALVKPHLERVGHGRDERVKVVTYTGKTVILDPRMHSYDL